MDQKSTEQKIVDIIRRILMRQEAGTWLTADYLYAHLLAHPARYGVEGAFGMSKLDKFRRVCEVMFETRGSGNELEVYCSGD